jgi:uncharacterized protein (TIGR02145 family)
MMFLKSIIGIATLTICIITSHAQNQKSVIIGKQIWMANNLKIETFRNGDSIFFAKGIEEWTEAGKNKIPAWCYPNFNNSNNNGGKLYNYFAVQDIRNIAPYGWRVASIYDYNNTVRNELIIFLKSLKGKEADIKFHDLSSWWVSDNEKYEANQIDCPSIYIGGDYILHNERHFPENAFFVLCIKE